MEKKRKWSIRRSELSIGSWNSTEWQIIGLLLVVCSMTLAQWLQMPDHHSWSKRETWRSLCAAERSREWAVLQRLIGRAHWESGAVPWTALKTRRQSLYLICSGTHSQWSLSRSRPDTIKNGIMPATSCSFARRFPVARDWVTLLYSFPNWRSIPDEVVQK